MRCAKGFIVLMASLFLMASVSAVAVEPQNSSDIPRDPLAVLATPLVSTESVVVPNAPAGTAFIAATWGDNAVHFLDANLNNLGSFSTGSNPNGIATDGTHIFVGSFLLPGVFTYDMNGAFQYQWSSDYCSGLQGLEYVSGTLAVSSAPYVNFLSPIDGSFIRSIPNQGGTVEGITFDGTYLWQLGDQIIATDPATGAVVRSIPNAALGCNFGGTGLAASGPDELTLGCAGGTWYKVSSVDGSVIASGNNGLQMYGLKYVGSIAPVYDLSFYDDFSRSAVCVNSGTGDWQFTVLTGLHAGVYSGSGIVSGTPTLMQVTSTAKSAYRFSLTYYPLRFTASSSLKGSNWSSALSDRNTKDDPQICGSEQPAH